MDLLDPNAVGVIGAASVTGLFAMLTTVLMSVRKSRNITKDIGSVVQQTAESTETTVNQTRNIGNGFTDRMDRKLNTIIQNQDSLSIAFREHLEWHLNQEASKK